MLRLDDISKTFTTKAGTVEAVRNVSLEIGDGEIFGIIGFSGAGKSTLVRCMNLLERPDSGKVYVDGTEVTALSERALRTVRRRMGMIFQHFNLLQSRTVYDNVAFPLRHTGLSKAQIAQKVNSLLELVELSDKRGAYPSQLSGGQKQRVAIARALANDPKVLLCDEATSALDPQTTQSILTLLRELNRRLGLTIVIITHEMAVIKQVCQRVAVMENGIVVEMGDVFTIFSKPRQAVTRRFIATTSSLAKIYPLVEEHSPVVALQPGEQLLQLKFLEKSASSPLVSDISRKFDLDVNILFGDIEIIQDAPLGGLVVVVGGNEGPITDAIAYLREKHVDVEVIARG